MGKELFEQIAASVDFIKSKVAARPKIGIILGTGLSNFTSELTETESISYVDIPNFSTSTVKSHKGELVFGKVAGKSVVVMAGRFHYYEGYDMDQVSFPIRVLKYLGVKTLLISNAAGGVNENYFSGDVVAVNDHINLLPANPLRGYNDERIGDRFPDMSDTYDKALIDIAMKTGKTNGFPIHSGVYVALQGPNLETPAEYNFIHTIGGDMVGMSTVPEVLVAKHMNMRLFVLSVISNRCFPLSEIKKTTLESVIEVANLAEPRLSIIFKAIIKDLP